MTRPRVHASTYVRRRCDLRDNVNSPVKGPTTCNCTTSSDGREREKAEWSFRETERTGYRAAKSVKRENEGKEIRSYRSYCYICIRARVQVCISCASMHIHTHVHIDISYACTRGTARVRPYTRCNGHVLFRLTLVQCLARVDPALPLFRRGPRTRGWPRGEIKMRRDGNPRCYPAVVYEKDVVVDDDEDDDNGAAARVNA